MIFTNSLLVYAINSVVDCQTLPTLRHTGEFKSADLYADMAIRHNRYNAKALVNKGNCLFMSKEYGRAKEIFLEAIGVEVRDAAGEGVDQSCECIRKFLWTPLPRPTPYRKCTTKRHEAYRLFHGEEGSSIACLRVSCVDIVNTHDVYFSCVIH